VKAIVLSAGILSASTLGAAEPVFLIAAVESRTTVSLDGAWASIVDPYENGYYDFHGRVHTNGYFKNAKPASKSELLEYDFDRSPALQVPGDWNTQRESLFFYEGTVWYKKSFDPPQRPGTRAFLHFGAANYHAIVWVNGERVGEHEGGFTPFALEVTKVLRPKDNFVVVKVDNTRRRDGVPTVNTDWWNYGGLTRGVRLVVVPETFVQDYGVQLARGARDEIAGFVQLSGPKAAQKVTVSIPEARAQAVVTADASGRAEFRMKARLDLWSPERPKLYDVRLAAETDTVTDRIGFRTIEVRGTEILLNGAPIFLRGISAHEEAPHRGGRGGREEDARTMLGWVKELGGNFVRLAHYPHSEITVREADRLGLLVWSEIPVYWTIQFDNPAVYEKSRRQLEEMIVRDRNRASVVIWSVANETPRSDARDAFLKKLAGEAKRLDPTRLVSAALLARWASDREIVLDDALAQSLDVIGCNEYIGWYGPDPPEKADVMSWTNPFGKPLVISEFGADARYGHHGDAETRWTEEYQEKLFEHQIGMLKRIPFLRGVSPWILMDFRSPRRPLPGIQDYWNRKGLVSERGEKKKAYFVLQQYYAEKAAEAAGEPSADERRDVLGDRE
jgi:beta-glucuronidase